MASAFAGSSAIARPASRSARARASVAAAPGPMASSDCAAARRAWSVARSRRIWRSQSPSRKRSTASTSSRALPYRSRGSRAVARAHTASSSGGSSSCGARTLGRASAPTRVELKAASRGEAGCSGSWARSSKRIAPSAYTSDRASTGSPSTCSGAMYPGVPIVAPCRLLPAPACAPLVGPTSMSRAPRSFASPQSRT